MVIKVKGKTGKTLHENAKYLEKLSIFFLFFIFYGFSLTFFNNKYTGGSEKQQIN